MEAIIVPMGTLIWFLIGYSLWWYILGYRPRNMRGGHFILIMLWPVVIGWWLDEKIRG